MELVNIYYKGAGVTYQDYNPLDENLVISNYIFSSFGAPEDVIEYVVYDESGQFLDVNYSLTEYKPEADSVDSTTNTYSSLQLDPKADLVSLGYNRGLLNIQYNFLKNLFNSSYTENYWIKEISLSRTELKLSSQVISNDQIVNGFNAFQTYIANKNYFADFYLNFGQNRLIIANNVALYTEGEETFLLVKLYEPLPIDFDVKTTLWIIDKLAESVSFDVDTQVEAEPEAIQNSLRGPNFKVKVSDRIGQTTPYYTYDALFSSNLSSSMQQLASYYDDKAISINVDYTDFSNFIHFSSAVERINNFVYKLGLIESYESELVESKTFVSMSSDTLYAVTQSNLLAQNNIDNIIKKFDTYEYYLYFSSESFAWPKSNSTKPYALMSVTSSEALSWLGSEDTLPTTNAVSILYSASYYDNTNQNKLSNAIPQYLLEDPNNTPYVTFIDMVGQHFDNIWLYYKDVSSRYDSSNNPNTGISMDLVADALRSMGLKLYTNTSVSDNLYYTLFGMNPDGSLLPPTGSEVINNYVTSSIDTISSNDLEKETYKRIYHNLPYLLKTKGTQRGVKALIACYGIPESILSVNEFGGNNRYTGSGIYEINDEKINVISSSEHIQSNLLYPTTTLQKYNTDYRLNTTDIEVGFSPSDVINANFVSSSGFVSMDQLIGNPQYQTLNSYPTLDEEKKTYFSTYTYPHSVWEYMRLVKYYNNSLFKMIKDFVPAKSNVSTGIIVKSHILERNKYARHEPSMSFDNNLSESIDLVTLSAGDAMEMSSSTAWSGNVMTPLGYASYSSSYNAEKYTGEFSGSEVFATDGQALDQTELSKNSSGSVQDIRINYGAIYQNVTASVRSTRFLDLDYSYDQSVPVNLGLITQSISQSHGDNYNTYTNPYNPYAQLQDSNYATRAFTEPRYYGSKTISKLYNVYSPPSSSASEETSFSFTEYNPGGAAWLYFAIQPTTYSNPNIIGLSSIEVYIGGHGLIDPSNYTYYPGTGTIIFTPGGYYPPIPSYIRITSNVSVDNSYIGDRSYGKTAAIDKKKQQFAYLTKITTASLVLPNRGNAEIKYLVDSNENVLDLSKPNYNIFETQNIFKSGESTDVSLFVYNNSDPSIRRLTNNRNLQIFKGGFRYYPILHNISGSHVQTFDFFPPLETTITIPGGSLINPADIPYLNDLANTSNWEVTLSGNQLVGDVSRLSFNALYTGPTTNFPVGTPSGRLPSDADYQLRFTLNIMSNNVATTYYLSPYNPITYNAGSGTWVTSRSGNTVNLTTTRLRITSLINSGSTVSDNFGGGYIEIDDGAWSTGTFIGQELNNDQFTIRSILFETTGSTLPDTYYTTYTTSITASASESCFCYRTASIGFDSAIVFRGPLGNVNYEHTDLIFNSTSDPAWNSSIMEAVTTPFSLNTGDEIHLYTNNGGWLEQEEYIVKKSYYSGSGLGSRLYVELDREVNIATLSGLTQADPVYGWKSGSCRYIITKIIPDETNVILRFNPTTTITQEGMLYPQYIDEDLRTRSGDIIKSLKSQNLI